MRFRSRAKLMTAAFKTIAPLVIVMAIPRWAQCQQTLTGFAVERFYPSAPGGGWFVMDDLSFAVKLGAAVELTGGYSATPLKVPPTNAPGFSLVSGQSFIDVGAAINWSRYRAYLNLPIPITVSGTSGMIGAYQVNAPAVDPGTNPDTISDPRLGFDVRIFGTPDSRVRLGASGQLIFPSGSRSDYLSDARYRGMFRFLAAGDSGPFSWAGQVGVHLRSLHDLLIPGGPDGNELLFGAGGGRRISEAGGWRITLGPEIFGETAFSSFLQLQQTGLEGLITTRFEQIRTGPRVRWKVGVGHGIVEHFGAPHWRVLAAVELVGEHP